MKGKVFINGRFFSNIDRIESSLVKAAMLASEEVIREAERIKMMPIHGINCRCHMGEQCDVDKLSERLTKVFNGGLKSVGKTMKIQDLMKPENHGKEFTNNKNEMKYKFDREQGLMYEGVSRCGWSKSAELFNGLLSWEFTEYKKPYTFLEALNDDIHAYCPEDAENHILTTHYGIGTWLVTDAGERTSPTKDQINGKWFRV